MFDIERHSMNENYFRINRQTVFLFLWSYAPIGRKKNPIQKSKQKMFKMSTKWTHANKVKAETTWNLVLAWLCCLIFSRQLIVIFRCFRIVCIGQNVLFLQNFWTFIRPKLIVTTKYLSKLAFQMQMRMKLNIKIWNSKSTFYSWEHFLTFERCWANWIITSICWMLERCNGMTFIMKRCTGIHCHQCWPQQLCIYES